MVTNRLLKPLLFIYECIRILILAAFVITSPAETAFPKLVFAAPGALFPLMALFLWLDVYRYRAYLPLFTAGKCIGIFSLVGWSILSRHFTMAAEFKGANYFEWVLICGDFLAIAVILMINRDVHKEEVE